MKLHIQSQIFHLKLNSLFYEKYPLYKKNRNEKVYNVVDEKKKHAKFKPTKIFEKEKT